jgi:hypothetical protein
MNETVRIRIGTNMLRATRLPMIVYDTTREILHTMCVCGNSCLFLYCFFPSQLCFRYSNYEWFIEYTDIIETCCQHRTVRSYTSDWFLSFFISWNCSNEEWTRLLSSICFQWHTIDLSQCVYFVIDQHMHTCKSYVVVSFCQRWIISNDYIIWSRAYKAHRHVTCTIEEIDHRRAIQG